MANNTYTLIDVIRHCSYVAGDLADTIESVEGYLEDDPALRVLVDAVEAVLREMNRHDGLRLQGARHSFQTVDDHTTGTVDVTQGSATISGNTASLSADHVGRAFATDVHDSIYRITAVDATAQTATLDQAFVGDTATEQNYRIAQDRYEAPSNFKEIRAASIAGDYSGPLTIVTPEDIDYRRVGSGRFGTGRTKIVEVGTPGVISIDKERSSSRNFNFLLDIFPDDIYQVNLLIDLSVARLTLDSDPIPVEDDNIDVLFRGVNAYWRHVQGETDQDRAAWDIFIETTLPRFFASDNRRTDRNAQLVPADVMRNPSARFTGRYDWKDR